MKKNSVSYIHIDSPVDKLNPLTKLLFLTNFVVSFFISTNFIFLISSLVLGLTLVHLAKIQKNFYKVFFSILIVFVSFIFILQIFFYPENSDLLFSWNFIKIYREGLVFASLISLRIINLVVYFLIFIMTTKPKKLITSLLEKKLNSKFAYLILATLQIPNQMSRKSYKIREAQISRGLKTTGNTLQRFKAFIPLISPLITSSLAEVEERALALEIRGFNSSVKKSSLLENEDTEIEKKIRIFSVLIPILVIVKEVFL